MFHLTHLKGAFRLATEAEWVERAELVGTPLNKTSPVAHALKTECVDRRAGSEGNHPGFHVAILPDTMFN
jgi:hypothetical protein